MADNSSFGASKPNQAARLAASDPIFGSPFEFLGLENIQPTKLTTSVAESFFSAIKGVGQEIAGTQEQASKKGLPAHGEVKGFQTPSEQLRLMETQRRVQIISSALQEPIIQQKIDMDIQGMSSEERNKLAHYQYNYEHNTTPYAISVVRTALVQQSKDQDRAKKIGSIPVPKGKAPIGVDLEAQGEGGKGRGGSVISSTVTAG